MKKENESRQYPVDDAGREKQNAALQQLHRYYGLWKESNAVYEEWAKEYGLSSNELLILQSLEDGEENLTQKAISRRWLIPKQTVSTILKDFEERGYVVFSPMAFDKRNKQIRLTPKGKEFTGRILLKLQEKELYVLKKMGLERVLDLNDSLELFIRFFREGGPAAHE